MHSCNDHDDPRVVPSASDVDLVQLAPAFGNEALVPPIHPKLAANEPQPASFEFGAEHVSNISFFGRHQRKAAIERRSERVEFFRALGPHRRTVITTGAVAGCSALMEVAVITIIASFAGRMLAEETSNPIFSGLSDRSLIAVAILTISVKILVDLLYARRYSHALYDYESGLRSRIAQLQANCGWATIEDSSAGSIHSLLWTSVHRSREGFAQAIGIISNLASLVLMLAATIVAARLMIIPVVVGLVAFGLGFRPLIRATRKTSLELREAYLEYGKELNESIAMSREARILGIQDLLASRLASAGDSTAKAVAKQSLYSTLMSTGYSDAIYVAVILGFAVISGASIADPAPLAAIVLLLYRSMGYGQGLQSALQNIASSGPFIADVNRWLNLLEANTENGGTVNQAGSFETISFDDVALTYPNGHVGLLGLSTTVCKGESIALVGPSGSGKSSFVTLLLALRRQTGGSIAVNGESMDELDLRSWRSNLALVPQDNLLFDATIEENVRCWRDIPDERIVKALRQANILDEVLAMDAGLATLAGEGGKRLSGGQRQRVCLARALAGDPALLVLDEPTSALDPASERAVKDTLEAIKGDVTLVIIAHRMTTITICDRVLVLDNGRLEHDGPPAVVARESEYFARALELSDGA